jgi:signal transduction histidine kinase/HAMP domain-containing protein
LTDDGPGGRHTGSLSERLARADRAAEERASPGAADARPAGGGPNGGSAPGDGPMHEARAQPIYRGPGVGFRTRLTFALITAAVLPVAAFGVVVIIVTGTGGEASSTITRVLLLATAVAVVVAVLLAAVLAADLGAPLRAIAASVDRVSAGDLGSRLELPGDDELSRLAESHNRLASDLQRRNQELRQILEALEETSLGERPEVLARRAGDRARAAFTMIDCEVLLVDPDEVEVEELVPGEPRQVRADLIAAGEVLGVAVGHVPPTRTWERADQDLFELFAIEISTAIWNARLYAQIQDQNRRLMELDEAKDDFLRGVSHNLQTPLASIRGYADQLAADNPDRRLAIITEQADRLSRMVRQLLTVSRLASGALRPRLEVLAPAARVRRTWEALGASDVPFTLEDASGGWLALADPDQLDQVLWAILDNAVDYGGRTPVEVAVRIDEGAEDLAITIADHGPGIGAGDRARLFLRFERGESQPSGKGSGLGLYVSRELCRAMAGDLVLEPASEGRGAVFTIHLPAEHAEET